MCLDVIGIVHAFNASLAMQDRRCNTAATRSLATVLLLIYMVGHAIL